ncbi:glycerophosphodiester phosphodiesterase [Lactobacillus acidophilus]|uniref:glycerophosphodiester phosphodiesterase n=1 Tax=Lactobacillus acidophilus TaxID=1579 RepID=UPI0021A2C360|nr:glycerophosphodiester phosphodiesterase [Lactobacillus acidophilus]MCT3602154.1 glycerophosphodiester phosphodiesterase [Lactobacillus acidophilus]MCT3623739.1 glycerophosphodiester phosphodiesterase [Lactobacillus acidophilus]
MNIFKKTKNLSAEFKQNWFQYLILFTSISILNQFIFIPLFRYITTFVLQAGAIPFISYSNLVIILSEHPFVVFFLLIELALLLFVIYSQFALIILFIKNNFALKASISEFWQCLRHFRLGSLLLLAIYFLLVIPFANVVFRTPLLAKIKIPQFIIDYMTRSGILLAILIIFNLVIFVLAFRFLLTLPMMVIYKTTTREAMKKSAFLMKKNWRKVIGFFVPLGMLAIVIMAINVGGAYLLQLIWDTFPGKFALIMATINLTLFQIISEVFLIWVSAVSLYFLIKLVTKNNNEIKEKVTNNKIILITIISIWSLAITGNIIENVFYLAGSDDHVPVTISHRGVNDKNGVQNTIESLKKTAKLKPDYVEIDVHETKDNQFVIMHDENLKKLTGKDKRPKELTLNQLTKLIAKEDGYKGKVVSLDQYMQAAQKLKQKLLIEIKTTPNDSNEFLVKFNKKYGHEILKNHYQLQSLDYRVVTKMQQLNPKIETLYIQPYNLIYPQSVADGYSMEYSTLSSDFIWQAHLQNHVVYAWTVNNKSEMKKMMYEHVDGIITDNISMLHTAIKEFQSRQSYANRILNYMMAFPILD